MIRLNVFFKIKETENIPAAIQMGNTLVDASLRDKGCRGYGMFQSTIDPSVFTIVETWSDQESLDMHSKSEHFTKIVPRLESIAVDGLKLERFDF